jgi:hypothetical protein
MLRDARHRNHTALRTLLPFYTCYRAYVRGKVDSLKSDEAEVEAADRIAAADSARRHFALAYRYTWAETRALVVVFGLSGSGKTEVARALAERTGFATSLRRDSQRASRPAGAQPWRRGSTPRNGAHRRTARCWTARRARRRHGASSTPPSAARPS